MMTFNFASSLQINYWLENLKLLQLFYFNKKKELTNKYINFINSKDFNFFWLLVIPVL